MYHIFKFRGDWHKVCGELFHKWGCVHALELQEYLVSAGELPKFYMYTQLYMVLLVSEHLLLLKRQPCSDLPTERILSIDFKDTWIGWNAVIES